MSNPPSSLLGFLHLPQLVQVLFLFLAFGGFVYCIETEQYIAATVIAGLFVYYFYVRRRFRRYQRAASGRPARSGSIRRRRKARRDVDGDAPDD